MINASDCQYKWLHNQVNQVISDLMSEKDSGNVNPTLVSITIGANDFQFADPNTIWNTILIYGNGAFDGYIKQRQRAVDSSLQAELNRLLSFDNVDIVVTEVHNPFNPDSFLFHLPFNRCREASHNSRDFSCYERTQEAVNGINTAIHDAVNSEHSNRVRVAPVYQAFLDSGGHESPHSSPGSNLQSSCGFAGPSVSQTWIQYADDPNSNSDIFVNDYSFLGRTLLQLFVRDADKWTGDCFHPNDSGAAEYALSVNETAIQIGR